MIAFDVQFRLAMVQADFRDRVAAASFTVAVQMITAAPIASGTAGTTQAQRLYLARNIIRDPTFAMTLFSWVVVSRPQFNDPVQLDDTALQAQISSTFDAAAGQYTVPAVNP